MEPINNKDPYDSIHRFFPIGGSIFFPTMEDYLRTGFSLSENVMQSLYVPRTELTDMAYE